VCTVWSLNHPGAVDKTDPDGPKAGIVNFDATRSEVVASEATKILVHGFRWL
jgi:hypothetical protein